MSNFLYRSAPRSVKASRPRKAVLFIARTLFPSVERSTQLQPQPQRRSTFTQRLSTYRCSVRDLFFGILTPSFFPMLDLEVVVSLVIGLVMLGVVGCFVAYFRKDIVECLTPAARRHNHNDAIPMHPSPTPLPGRFSQSLDYGRGQPLTSHPASSDPEFAPTPDSLPEQTSLLDRMREIQTLMVEIHHLESDPGSNNRPKIQELQRRIAELGDAQDSDTDEISSHGLGPPSGSARDDPA